MSWRLAPALITFIRQCDKAAPGRDTRSDGTLGDASHRSRASDHNPDGRRVVNAVDITHGPFWHRGQIDCGPLVAQLVASGDPRIKYIIFQRRIWQPGSGWKNYSGASPHLEHLHLSVTTNGGSDGRSWNIPMFGGQAAPSPPTQPTPTPQPLPTPPSPASDQVVIPKDRAMLTYFRNPHNPAEIWVTDFFMKRHVSTPEEVKTAQIVGFWRGINVGPFDIDAKAFDSIPGN